MTKILLTLISIVAAPWAAEPAKIATAVDPAVTNAVLDAPADATKGEVLR
jgi:hypothetical protein